MKILLIAPASGNWKTVSRNRLFNGKTFRFSMLSLLSVAAETPLGAEIRIVDEQIDEIPWEEKFDLVGITCMTALAPRVYELASRFRALGIPVVLGGMHPTFCPDEALQHCDGVVAGEAEGVWPRVVEDVRNGCLGGIYRSDHLDDLSSLKKLPRHLLPGKGYSTRHAVQATRGCPHRCSFCSVSAFNKHTHRRRPVEQVIEEIRAIPAKSFMFVDDNLIADREYAARLFREMIPLKKRWITQVSLSMADDPEFVKLAAQAGCIGVFVGIETFSDGNLDRVDKTINRTADYRERIRVFHSYGIGIEAGIVFGFDQDSPEVFSRTLAMLDRLEIDLIQTSILTPLPGTAQYPAMEDRILDKDWSHYDFHHAVFSPSGMSAEALQAGHDWVTHEFYRPWRIARRVWRHLSRPNGWLTWPYVLAINLAYYGRVQCWNFKGWDPAREQPVPKSRHSVLGFWKNLARRSSAVLKPEAIG
ncbi:MAG TPA: radical SAM protein [bacterium]|nr:radical SAM protein [bacterium]HQO36290.1 radical SAM protein [bacterium]